MKVSVVAVGLVAPKESIHEMGHTLGLEHYPRSFCVMYFSDSIFDTDKKQSLFCDQCFLQASIAITEIGNRLDRTTT